GLASDSGDAGVKYWVFDLVSPELVRRIHDDSLDKVRAPGDGGVHLMQIAGRTGWKIAERRSYLVDALAAAPERMRNIAERAAAAGQTAPPPADDPSGVYLLERA